MEYFTPHTTKSDYSPGRVLVYFRSYLTFLSLCIFFLNGVISSIKDMDMRFLS